MPFDGSGTFNRVFNWATDKANSINITASRVDTEDSGFATGLSNCLTRDGQGKPTAPINWNGQTITNIASIALNADPTTALQAATKQYVDNNIQLSAQNWGGTAGGTANAITITLTPVPTAYTAGMLLAFITGASPSSGAVTVNANGLGAKNLVRSDGTALANNDLPANSLVVARYDGAAGNLKLETFVASQAPSIVGANNTWTGTNLFNGVATFGAEPVVQVGNSTSGAEFQKWVPTDFATGKPYLFVKKNATATQWDIGLFDGTNGDGSLAFTTQAFAPFQALVDAATIAWDAAINQNATVTLGGNRILGAPTNLKNGAVYNLKVIQDGTGTRTLDTTTAGVFKFPGGVHPTLSTAVGAIDILSFISDGTNLYGVAAFSFS